NDRPDRRFSGLYGVAKFAVADHFHPHAGLAGRRSRMKITFQARRGFLDQRVELQEISLSLRIEIEIGLQAIDIDAKHRALWNCQTNHPANILPGTSTSCQTTAA